MTVQDVLIKIREYFCTWHEKYYDNIHHILDNITNTGTGKKYPPTSKAVYDAINTLDTCKIKQGNSDCVNNPPSGSLQKKINSVDKEIDDINAKLKQANYGDITKYEFLYNSDWHPLDWVDSNGKQHYDASEINYVFPTEEKYQGGPIKFGDDDHRGFDFPDFDNYNVGFMSAYEKMDLYYTTKWFEIPGKFLRHDRIKDAANRQAKGYTSTEYDYTDKLLDGVRVWLNIGLRLVYFSLSIENKNWFVNKDLYQNPLRVRIADKSKTKWYKDLWWYIRPFTTITLQTSNPHMVVTIESAIYPDAKTSKLSTEKSSAYAGTISFRSSLEHKNPLTFTASGMWFYRDSKPSSHVNKHDGSDTNGKP